MKYGIITYAKRPMRQGGKNRLNIGDPIQTYAMKHIYNMMGIEQEELIEVSRYHTKNYNGEYVLLPFNCFNRIYNQLGHPYGTFPLSSKVIPLFISFHLHTRVISDDILNNLKAYQPIGCRDEETMINMRNHGISAYLSGCVTALLPRRKNLPSCQKTFFVDIPDSLEGYIPNEIKENAEYKTHHILLERSSDDEWLTDEEYERFYNLGVQQLTQYENEATLVVTSRLHAAIPCMALGIPVILVSDNFDKRFSWVEKYLDLYTPNKFKDINWYPEAIEYEEHKKYLTDFYIAQIRKAYQEYSDMYSVSSFYENRDKITYCETLLNELSNLPIAKNKAIKYGIWGLTTMAELLINTIADNYPNWVLNVVVDKTADGNFLNKTIIMPTDIENTDTDIIYFIIPVSAHKPAKEQLDKLGRSYVLLNGIYMTYCNPNRLFSSNVIE